MDSTKRKLLICDCAGTMRLDAAALGAACGRQLAVHRDLCRSQIGTVAGAAADGAPLMVACTQEAPVFRETLKEVGASDDAVFVNIRERAGWSDEGDRATAKIAALLAEASVDIPQGRSMTLESAGRALLIGDGETALDAAGRIADRLTVTVVLSEPGNAVPPAVSRMAVFRGQVTGLEGHFGAFRAATGGVAPARPSSRGVLEFDASGPPVTLDADIVVDLTGGESLMTAPEKRDGYFRARPGDAAGVAGVLAAAADMVGEFEKPIYINFDAALCAHSRSTITGCTRCLDICPASAIRPAGDAVHIDPAVCAGCGGCAGVCPTGAAKYDAPPTSALVRRLQVLLDAYRGAGGAAPVLLVHDTAFGSEMIGMMARLGRGLPARVLPFAVNEVTQLGFDALVTAAALGAGQVVVVLPPGRRGEADGLRLQLDMAGTVLEGLGFGAGRLSVCEADDPDAVAELLYGLAPMPELVPAQYHPAGSGRRLAAMALDHLHANAPLPQDMLELSAGAPFGGIAVADGCTLCLACVGACPTGALSDNPDAPMLKFREEACIQCGLCRRTCPESVMTLLPRFNFAGAARRDVILNEEAPFECVSCGKPFATPSVIEKTLAKLADHPMFAGDAEALNRLRMCEDCRLIDQFSDRRPFARGTVQRPRTTDDYLNGGGGDDEC